MSAELLVFYALAGITLGSAAMVVRTREPFHCALWCALSLFSIAGHYVLLRAEFVAVMQVLIYVGAVMILIIFVIMLTRRTEPI
ncbi:MAG: NADH-quinone oxidoreductase subunit J [Methanonatronarchaeales archaeon]|nr:NADH-quinone oxidoreductase subunit J [Methanonatronarchaeales archaeon]